MRVDKTKWTKTILSEITHITMGQSPDSSSYNKDAIGLPFYQGNADFGPIHPTPRIYCDAPTRTANEHELLISVRAPIGAINITNELCCIGRGLAAIQMIDGKSYLHFIKYILKAANEELNRQGTGMTFKAISKKVLFNLTICLPTFDIQQTIASELDAIQTMIDGYKAQLADLDALAQSIFLDMFGDPVTNPKGWNKHILNEICDVRDGTHDSPKYIDNGIPLITSKNIVDGKIDFSDTKNISISDADAINKRSKVDNGDIIMPMIGAIGNPIIVESVRPFCIKNVALIKFNNANVINIYIKYLLSSSSFDEYMHKINKGVAQKFISLTVIRNFNIPLPPFSLQQQFAHRVEAIEKQKELIKSQLADAETLMAERMQYYFS